MLRRSKADKGGREAYAPAARSKRGKDVDGTQRTGKTGVCRGAGLRVARTCVDQRARAFREIRVSAQHSRVPRHLLV
eukprot:488233-Rhodomonas_salina.1